MKVDSVIEAQAKEGLLLQQVELQSAGIEMNVCDASRPMRIVKGLRRWP